MPDLNSNASTHPCMNCEYGRMFTEQHKTAGNKCVHPDILKKKGLYYGRYHSLKTVPKWCPMKQEANHEQS